MRARLLALLATSLLVSACGSGSSNDLAAGGAGDAGAGDAGAGDAGAGDAASDATADAGDAGVDATTDGASDASTDAAPDAGVDAATDGADDAGDGATDAGEASTDADAGDAGAGDAPACAPGAYRCTGDLLEQCAADGASFAGVDACGAGLCDAAAGRCDACDPAWSECASPMQVAACTADGALKTLAGCPTATPWCLAGAGGATCVECTSASQCPAASDACLAPSCAANACGFVAAADGTACDRGGAGAGACVGGSCLACDPAAPPSCDGGASRACAADGSRWIETPCDALQGMTCDAATGRCAGACSPAALGASYVGCDYYATVTANYVDTAVFHFAIVVSNTGAQSATVTVTQGASTITTTTVAAGGVQVVQLPWIEALARHASTPPGSLVATASAYRVRSTQPVTVYQFSPLEYAVGGSYSYTNDASLLLPVNTWTGTYRVASRAAWTFSSSSQQYPGFYAVVASRDNTTVTVTPGANGTVLAGISGLPASGAGSFVLNAGDVAEVFSQYGGTNPEPYDLTGTLVSADAPVEVIAGHQCTFVPSDKGYCDHLEETMFPVETLASDYLVTAPVVPTSTTPKAQMVRVIATAPNTTIATDPPQPSAPASLSNAGDWFELALDAADFRVTASERVLVAQYMTGQEVGGGAGDPAMTLAVSTTQFRTQYRVLAPTSYATNYANVVAPNGAAVTIDGAPVTGFSVIGSSGYSVARVALSNAGDGSHVIDGGSAKIGVSIYGYGQYTSYWYPGGLNLARY